MNHSKHENLKFSTNSCLCLGGGIDARKTRNYRTCWAIHGWNILQRSCAFDRRWFFSDSHCDSFDRWIRFKSKTKLVSKPFKLNTEITKGWNLLIIPLNQKRRKVFAVWRWFLGKFYMFTKVRTGWSWNAHKNNILGSTFLWFWKFRRDLRQNLPAYNWF